MTAAGVFSFSCDNTHSVTPHLCVCAGVCVCWCVCCLSVLSSPPLTAPLFLSLSLPLCKGRRGQQPHAPVQGSTNGMLRMGWVGGAYEPTDASLRACFRESIIVSVTSAVLDVTAELGSGRRLTGVGGWREERGAGQSVGHMVRLCANDYVLAGPSRCFRLVILTSTC